MNSPALLVVVGSLCAAFSAQTARPIAPSAQPIVGNVQGYQTGSSGDRVVYLADQDTAALLEIYAAPLDGSLAAVKLNPPLTPGSNTLGRSFRVDATGSQAAFLVGSSILVAPTDGSAPAIPLATGVLFADRDNAALEFTPDGAWILYVEDLGTDSFHCVPTDGSLAPIELSAPFAGSIDRFGIASDDTRAFFLRSGTGQTQLFSAPLDGSAPAIPLNAPPVSSGGVQGFKQSLATDRVLYVADQDTDEVFELYSVLSDGSAPPVRLSGTMTAGGDIGPSITNAFALSGDGTRAFYTADQELDGRFELYSVPIDGSGAPIKLSGALGADRDVTSFKDTPDGRFVAFLADRDADEVVELFVVPADGSRPAGKLNPPLVPGGDVLSLFITADSKHVVYRADQEVDGRFELYSAPLEHLRSPGALRVVRLNAPLGPGSSVSTFLLSPDGRFVTYRASLLADGRSGPFGVPVRGGPSRAPVPAPSAQATFFPTPGNFGLYLGDPGGSGSASLFSWPLRGGSAEQLNP